MPFATEFRTHTFRILMGLAVLAVCAMYLTMQPVVAGLGLSPLVIGLLAGLVVGNTLRRGWVSAYDPGIIFCAKGLLRIAIVFYGFRITFQEVASVGLSAVLIAVSVVAAILSLGYLVGTRLLKLDRTTALLTAAGSAICGAAAVVAVESVVRSVPQKTTAALATVVLFGTLGMLLYPLIYNAGWLPLDEHAYGVYVGAVVHEVAQVVVAGNAAGTAAGDTAVVVKMTRVLLLVPVLLGIVLLLRLRKGADAGEAAIPVPWFALGFLAMVGVNSAAWLPTETVQHIVLADTFILTMAMTALGLETRLEHLRGMSSATFVLAAFLFAVLSVAGYGLVVALV